MINEISVQGFKSFKRAEIPFKPLTVLCGVNGSGKSSVMQLLLLLKALAVDAKGGLVKLNAGDLNLGLRRNVVYNWSDDGVIRIDFATDAGKWSVSSVEEVGASENNYIVFQEAGDKCGSDSQAKFFDEHVRYLSAERQPPKTDHQKSAYAVRTHDVGRHGETAVSLLYAQGQNEIPVELCHEDDAVNRTLKGQVNAWLGDVSEGVAVRITPQGDVLRLDIDYGATKPAQGFRPENVGFGISYVLPVLVMILTAQKGDCLLIENPGAHLHPQGQAQLGRLLAKAAAYGIQVIIETHSDHIVNGIRVGCKKRADTHPDECVMSEGVDYCGGVVIDFFERVIKGVDAGEEQYSRIMPIRIESNGELERYPLGFLDEWSHQMGELA